MLGQMALRRVVATGAIGILVLGLSRSEATAAPPVGIRLPATTKQAISGQEFAGVFEIALGEPGRIESVEINGEGWSLRSMEAPNPSARLEAGALRVPFRAVPADADTPLEVSLIFNGRRVTRSFGIGPQAFARRGRDRASVQIVPGRAGAPPQPGGQAVDTPQAPNPENGEITLRFTGRIVYFRPAGFDQSGDPIFFGGTYEGVDNILVEVMDEDDAAVDETIWSGYTNAAGYFDSGNIQWDDCDAIGCDEPDLYLRYECDTPVVNVQEPIIDEPEYSWSSDDSVIDDFPGGPVDFGTNTPADQAQMPALHIHNSIVRAHRFILTRSGTGINVTEVDLLWPDGDNAEYNWFLEEIHISKRREWHEDAHTHEYGHHFLENHSVNPSSDYCNDICDIDPNFPVYDCGHCHWCRETDHDAVNEGWPNWLGDVVTSDYPNLYVFSDGTSYKALRSSNDERLGSCDEFDPPERHDPFLTEGFVGALLRDISDAHVGHFDEFGFEEHDNDGDDTIDIDGITDCLALGPEEIFAVMVHDQPVTVSDFIVAFQNRYPQQRPKLWTTARNVHPAYVGGGLFPPDTQPPGAVQVVTSTSHPIGVGGPLPCITVHVESPPDDVTGACAYSVEWTYNPDGLEPGFTEQVTGTCVTFTSPAQSLGDHYLSIRTMDCAGHWSNEWATFGPFTVTECNNNGILDICEIPCFDVCPSPCSDPDTCTHACDASFLADDVDRPVRLRCRPNPDFCSILFSDCGQGQDCNLNLVPDDCDIASGLSQDCNEDGVPDECQQPFAHWLADHDGSWHDAPNWDIGVPPDYSNVCINRDPDVTVTYANGPSFIVSLACHDNLTLQRGLGLALELHLLMPSFVRGDLTLINGDLITNDDLSVGKNFVLTGSSNAARRLLGAGRIQVEGGLHAEADATIDGKTLALGGSSASGATSNGSLLLSNNALLHMLAGSTFDLEADGPGGAIAGTTGRFINEGYFVRSSGTGAVGISCRVINAGEIRVQSGTLYFARGGTSTGAFIADPGALIEFRGGQHVFLPGSIIAAEEVLFSAGISGDTRVHGTYNVADRTTVTNHVLYFEPDANVLSYGDELLIHGTVYFNHVAGRTLHFDHIDVDGIANFNSDDPIETQTLAHGRTGAGGGATIGGTSAITVTGMTTWRHAGHLFGTVTLNANGGMIVVPSSSSRNVDGDAVLNNAGYAALQGGFGCRNNGKFNNLATGTVDIQMDGNVITRESPLPIDNAGLLVKTAGSGTSTIQLDVNNTGTVEILTGVLDFDRSYVQTAGETFLNGGNLWMSGTPALAVAKIRGGSLHGAGTITGNVEVAVCDPGPCAAEAMPGGLIGTLNVTGGYTHGPGGTLHVELGGLNPGLEHDQLTVGGTAQLQGGTLHVVPAGGFIPQVGQQFVILTAASVQGAFDGVTGPGEYTVVYNPQNVTLVVSVAPCEVLVAADFDTDCDVDAHDVAAFVACASGPQVPLEPGCEAMDLDGGGDGDQADFALIQRCLSGENNPADPSCES